MAHLITPLWNRLTGGLRRQSPRPRRRSGSVLILVVALLVLMALIGTAWISTARTDRYATVQHAFNTEIDMLVEGVGNMIKSVLAEDLFAPPPPGSPPGTPQLFRPAPNVPVPPQTTKEYENFDWGGVTTAGAVTDSYLATRIPVRVGPSAAPGWATISGPLVATPIVGAPPEYVFEDVRSPATLPRNTNQYANRQNLEATFVTIDGRNYPALTDYSGGSPATYLAGDADGDGIADAGLVRLPIGQVNGLTYYAAVRIVDNNSAINLNTGLSRDHDFTGDGGRLGTNAPNTPFNADLYQSHTFFPSRVGLAELLRTYSGMTPGTRSPAFLGAEMNGLLKFRLNDTSNAPNVTAMAGVYGNPYNDQGGKWPVDENGLWRLDFQFVTMGEAMTAMLSNRLGNPGAMTPAPATGSARRFRALPQSDAGALAYRGGAVLMPDWSPGVAEDRARVSLYPHPNPLPPATPPPDPMRTDPYPPDGAEAWYTQLYTYSTPPATPTGRVRSLLTTSNPVSNVAPWHAMAALPATMKTPIPSAALATSLRVPESELQSILPHLLPNLMPNNQLPNPAGATAAPIETVIPKASVNTAEFGELWRAYWMVMSNRLGLPPTTGAMFRSPLRDPFDPVTMSTGGAANLAAPDTMALRAAIAAVNTIDLRDADNDVTSVNVSLPSGIQALVNGIEPQPFITEVYVNNDNSTNWATFEGRTGVGTLANPRGYVAIELYNPYPVPISLFNWNLAVIDRRHAEDPSITTIPPVPATATYPSMPLMPLVRFNTAGGFNAGGTAPVIPAGGRLLLENFSDPTATVADPHLSVVAQDAQSRPHSAAPPNGALPPGTPRYFVPGLEAVIRDLPGGPPPRPPTEGGMTPGGELVLLRPRKAGGVPLLNGAPHFVETVPASGTSGVELSSLVPVDSFDFTGITQQPLASAAPVYRAYHYVRRSGATTHQWRFVYPGQWHASHPWPLAAALPFRQEGIDQQEPPRIADGTDPWAAAGGGVAGGPLQPVTLGLIADDAMASYRSGDYFPPVQLNNVNWPGPNGPVAAGAARPNLYPFGAFPRNGDILQVPFVGSYRLRSAAMAGSALVYEFTPVTADIARADDDDSYDKTQYRTDPTQPWGAQRNATTDLACDDEHEMLGRFCPIGASAGPAVRRTLTSTDPLTGVTAYDWAADLFDYLTISAPHTDYLPNVYPPAYHEVTPPLGTAGAAVEPTPMAVNNSDPSKMPEVVWGRVQTGGGTSFTARAGLPRLPNGSVADYANKLIVFQLPGGTVQSSRIRSFQWVTQNNMLRAQIRITPSVTGVGPDVPFKIISPVSGAGERTLGTEGLVNINTAPLKVLQQLPLVVDPASGRVTPPLRPLNDALAAAIVNHRQTTGPFASLFDLNSVEIPSSTATFQNAAGRLNPTGKAGAGVADPDEGWGDYSPGTGAADGIVGDFESRFLMMNRLSNLVTTRSDTFTCYVLVQGWRGVGGPNPELVVQRRRAFIADRTGVTPTNRDVATQNFYNE